MSNKRFILDYRQGSLEPIEIWIDSETGINYLFKKSGSSGGLTPLLDKNGNPIVSKINDIDK